MKVEVRPEFERYVALLRGQRNVKASTIECYLRILNRFLRWTWRRGKGFEDWNADLATEYIASFDNPNTRASYAIALKQFFTMMEYPDASRFKVPRNPRNKLPDILSEDEVLRLAKACDRVRDRALILVTYESTRRCHEVLGLRIRDVEIDEYGALVTFHSTKSEDATIRLVKSASVLQTLLEQHRDRDNPNAYVFYAKNARMTDVRFRQILRDAAKKAGLKRHVWPHLLRHSGIARYKRENYLTDSDLMNITGHRDRRQLDRYGKITMTMTNEKLLEIEGLKKVEAEAKPKAKKCFRCSFVNGPLAVRCKRCGLPLDVKEAMRLDEDLQVVRDNLPLLLEAVELLKRMEMKKQS